ncbi:beta-galactosidase 7-like [Nymphaea colorata]|nr:beta-galactosidase 7-like [Nymphaea colorata]
MWPKLIEYAKDGGLDAIETYIFWNAHEPQRRQYNFEGRLDFVKFLKTVQEGGLYAVVRIGPYVCAEWNYGGLPVWLHNIPGMEIRTNNDAFKYEMATFTRKIFSMMEDEGLLAWQGGPVILLQIENEYGNVMQQYGNAGKEYLKWAAGMAVSLNASVPWIMCQQSDAPAPMINTCNGFYCHDFEPNSPTSPKMWTENWTGWFKAFGSTNPHRPAEDLAYSVARFFQTGGTFQNYYMYHGGTNFGRTAGGPFITTSYDYDAPLDEYGQPRQPKWGHLRNLHSALKQMEKALIYGTRQNVSLGNDLEASIYKTEDGTTGCFLSNTNTALDATVTFNGNSYSLPAWSVTILPDCVNSIYNTAQVPVAPQTVTSKQTKDDETGVENVVWHKESIFYNIRSKDLFPAKKLLEQITTAADRSDYMWYTTGVHVTEDDSFWNQGRVILRVNTSGHSLHVFVNSEHAGFAYGGYGHGAFNFEQPINLKPGKNYITLLSATVGLQNYGPLFELVPAGINTGPVEIVGSNNATKDLSRKVWLYKIGLRGEDDLFTNPKDFTWTSASDLPVNTLFIWYKAEFRAPNGSESVIVNLGSMGKGQAWINGESIGRYWPLYTSPEDECSEPCDYRGPYNPSKCTTQCGEGTQIWYHVPRSWLNEGLNTLVLFEELGGNPSQIKFRTVH